MCLPQLASWTYRYGMLKYTQVTLFKRDVARSLQLLLAPLETPGKFFLSPLQEATENACENPKCPKYQKALQNLT